MSAFELKKISGSAVVRAIEKAEHYRDLNDPAPAESICLDVLAVDPGNQEALVLLILAITDQFTIAGSSRVEDAWTYLPQVTDDYERAYYSGIVCEREGKAFLTRGMASQFAYDDLRAAMDWYQKAEEIRPTGNDDAILRWNTCVRIIDRERLRAHEPAEVELPLE